MNVSKLCITLNEVTLVDIEFEIKESLALVGQSGSGKSLTLKALLGMLDEKMKCELKYSCDFRLIVGKTLSFVPQNPFTALSPLTKITKQFQVPSAKQLELLKFVGLESNLLERFPPELSGGQLQRVVIAMALENKPKLLMLDEPTTALDHKTKKIILDLLLRLQKELGFKILFVTHDIASAEILCEDICVIKDGRVVERGKLDSLLKNPKDNYTKTLIESNFSNREFRK